MNKLLEETIYINKIYSKDKIKFLFHNIFKEYDSKYIQELNLFKIKELTIQTPMLRFEDYKCNFNLMK